MTARHAASLGLIAVALAAGSAGASTGAAGPAAEARAFAISIFVPGQAPVSAASVEAPPNASAPPTGFAYHGDGSVVSAEAAAASVSADTASGAAASAAADVTKLSLFGGEIAADAVTSRSTAQSTAAAAGGDFAGSAFTNLVVAGQPLQAVPNQRVELGWGHATLLTQVVEQRGAPGDSAPPSYRGVLTALELVLDAEHGGLPAGTRILVGYAEALASVRPPPPKLPTPTVEVGGVANAKARPSPPKMRPRVTKKEPGSMSAARARFRDPILKPPEPRVVQSGIPSPLVLPTPTVTPRLTDGGYVFPVYGPAGYSNTFGAPRAATGWHHGEDIFAPLGAPVLAVADGTVFSVGWNDLGGNRLWLRDRYGNQFYYSHLAAFSTLAVNGAYVRAGDVLGFVGNSGDAEGTPYHLHFEIHPAALLLLDYDGVVDPNPYLNAWQRLEDITIRAAVGWVPAIAPRSAAPTPGAILLQSTDISSASGLDPMSLERAIAPVSAEEDGVLVGFGRRPLRRSRGGF